MRDTNRKLLVRLSKEIEKALELHLRESGMTKSAFVRRAILTAIGRLDLEKTVNRVGYFGHRKNRGRTKD